MDAIVYGLMPVLVTLILVFATIVGLAGEILHAELEATEEAAEEATEAVEEVAAGWANLELQLKVDEQQARITALESRIAQLEKQLLLQHAEKVVKKSIEDFDLDTKAGRAGARSYLRAEGIEIPCSTNRYQIRAQFRRLA